MSNGTQAAYADIGYDYVAAITELLKIYTYSEIAERVGYKSVGAVSAIKNGNVPSHVHGEAIFALYLEAFHQKPAWPYTKKSNNLTTGDS
jgi:hypothetical protein